MRLNTRFSSGPLLISRKKPSHSAHMIKVTLPLILSQLILPPVYAAKTEISLFNGYRTGGTMQEASTGNRAELDESTSYGFILGRDYGPEHVMEFLYSHQNTSLNNTSLSPARKLLNVDIEYFQLGGSQIWKGKQLDTFFGAGLGAIHLSDNDSVYASRTRLAMSFGGGAVIKLSKNLGLRLELRAYFSTFGNSSNFCAGNECVITGNGFMNQVDINAGLRFRF